MTEMTEPTDLRIVKRARAILSDPRRWCRNAWALDADGQPTMSSYPTAKQFCALGALHRAKYEIATSEGRADVLRDINNVASAHQTQCLSVEVMVRARMRHDSIVRVNDFGGGYDKILEIFDKAIANMGSNQ